MVNGTQIQEELQLILNLEFLFVHFSFICSYCPVDFFGFLVVWLVGWFFICLGFFWLFSV
jgi:hypothetical protein